MNHLIVDVSMVYASNNAKLGSLSVHGYPTGGIFGTARSVEAAISKFEIDSAFFCYDAGGGERKRTEISPSYKSGRIEVGPVTWHGATEEFMSHRSWIEDWASARGITQVHAAGYEGDDCIVWLHRYLTAGGRNYQEDTNDDKVFVMSADHDMDACLDEDTVTVWNLKPRNTLEKFVEEYGFSPKLYPMFLALAGDSTDAVPPLMNAKRARQICIDYENGVDFELTAREEEMFEINASLVIPGVPHRPSVRYGQRLLGLSELYVLYEMFEMKSMIKKLMDEDKSLRVLTIVPVLEQATHEQ